MAALHAFLQAYAREALTLGGLLIGFAFGVVAARANFCVMGAISDFRAFSSTGRLAAVALAVALATGLTQGFAVLGVLDLPASMYLAPRFNWAGAILGGLLFGAGMVYAGGCASRNLIRAGHGDVRALLVVIVVGVVAFATISGVIAPLRSEFETAATTTFEGPSPWLSLDAALAHFGVRTSATRLAGAAMLIVPLLRFAAGHAKVQHEPANLMGGLGVGALIAAGWLVTGLTYDDMALRPLPPQSLSFVRPIGDAIDWLERSTALGLPGFAAASIFGALAGSFTAALIAGRFHIVGFANATDIRRHLAGAVAMGIGGVLALGCSIGQGITGVSTLSLQSILAAASIFTGAWLALSRLERNI